MPTRLVHVVFDAVDHAELARFWASALGWRLEEEYLAYDEGVVRAPDDSGLEIITVPAHGPKQAKNRVHLDLDSASREDHDALLERLLQMGAIPADIGQDGVAWTVLADPEGNEFCVLGPSSDAAGRLRSIALDVRDPVVQAAFWSAATGWVVDAEESWGVRLRHPSVDGPALVMGPPVAPKYGKNRVHLDVAPLIGDDHHTEVERLLALGARRIDIGQADVPWTVLADPEDNEFCVLTPR